MTIKLKLKILTRPMSRSIKYYLEFSISNLVNSCNKMKIENSSCLLSHPKMNNQRRFRMSLKSKYQLNKDPIRKNSSSWNV